MEQQSYFSVTFLGIRIHFFCHHTNKGAIVLFFILLTTDPDTIVEISSKALFFVSHLLAQIPTRHEGSVAHSVSTNRFYAG